jgi:hypothetical protein
MIEALRTAHAIRGLAFDGASTKAMGHLCKNRLDGSTISSAKIA